MARGNGGESLTAMLGGAHQASELDAKNDKQHAERDRVGADPPDQRQRAGAGRKNRIAPNTIDSTPRRASIHS